MKTRPILFSVPMVRAILDGRKTQTRRAIKPQPPEDHEPPYRTSGGKWVTCDNRPPDILKTYPMRCPYGKPSDRLWVRETWAYCYKCARTYADEPLVKAGVIYRQQRDEEEGGAWGTCHPINPKTRDEEFRWRPSIFMPRWASRIDLEVLDVRAERVQDIGISGAIAEGISTGAFTATSEFEKLWNSINAKRGFGWDMNPWVWVVEFKVLEGE